MPTYEEYTQEIRALTAQIDALIVEKVALQKIPGRSSRLTEIWNLLPMLGQQKSNLVKAREGVPLGVMDIYRAQSSADYFPVATGEAFQKTEIADPAVIPEAFPTLVPSASFNPSLPSTPSPDRSTPWGILAALAAGLMVFSKKRRR